MGAYWKQACWEHPRLFASVAAGLSAPMLFDGRARRRTRGWDGRAEEARQPVDAGKCGDRGQLAAARDRAMAGGWGWTMLAAAADATGVSTRRRVGLRSGRGG